MHLRRLTRLAVAAVVATGGLAASAGVASAAKFTRLFNVNGTTAQAVGMTRTPDGKLHLVFQTFAGHAFSGLAAMAISPSGSPGPQSQVTPWQAGQPGLVSLPGGTLEAVFGATSPPPGNVASVWGSTSSDGGLTWSTPTDVKGGGPNESLAYGSDITAAMSGTTPILSLPQAGNVVIQRGLGPGSPSYQLTNSSDGSTTDADLGVDAATGEVVAGWGSIANKLTDYLQGASPAIGGLQAIPGQYRNTVVLAGRDVGPGVFAAYTPDNTHVRLLRYGGGSVGLGKARGVTAKVLGVATGPSGRIWVMWGDDSSGKVAVTRSNKAGTRFEPIQTLKANAFSIYRVQGDGRLGPLDLLVDEIPNTKGSAPPPGEYYARVRPVLSASVSITKTKNKQLQKINKVKVKVTDAGDPVPGAKVTVKGVSTTTNPSGVATLFVKGKGKATMTVTDAGYQLLKRGLHL